MAIEASLMLDNVARLNLKCAVSLLDLKAELAAEARQLAGRGFN